MRIERDKPTLDNTPTSLVTEFNAAMAEQAGPRTYKKDADGNDIMPPRMDDTEYAAMLLRMVRAWEKRVIENPEMLILAADIAQRCGEVVNVAMAYNALSYRIDPTRGLSMKECARVFGIGKSAAGERVSVGLKRMYERSDSAGVLRFAERKREREMIAKAHGNNVVAISAFLARKSAA